MLRSSWKTTPNSVEIEGIGCGELALLRQTRGASCRPGLKFR